MFVCLFPVVAESKEQVLQSPIVVSLEGAVAEISCNHSISDVYDFLWYLYFPGFAPRLLIKGLRPSQRDATTWHMRGSLHHCSSSRCSRQMRGFTIVLWGTQKQSIHEELNRNKERSEHLQDVEERRTITASPPTPNSASLKLFHLHYQEKHLSPNTIYNGLSLIAQLVISLQCRRPRFDSWVVNILWRRVRLPLQYSWASWVAQMVKRLPAMQETWVQSLGW